MDDPELRARLVKLEEDIARTENRILELNKIILELMLDKN